MSSNNDIDWNQQFLFIAIPYGIMTIIYFFIIILLLQKYIKIIKNKNALFIGKLFYLSISIQSCLRCLGCLTISLCIFFPSALKSQTINQIFNNFTNVPLVFIWIAYILLSWQLIILFYIGHINLSKQLYFVKEPIPLKPIVLKILLGFTIFLFVLQIISLFLYNFKTYNVKNFYIGSYSVDIFLIISLFIIMIGLNFKFSGIPYKSQIYRKCVQKFYKLAILWILGRIINGGYEIAFSSIEESLYLQIFIKQDMPNNYSKNLGKLAGLIFGMIAAMLFSEIIPFLYSYNEIHFKIFSLSLKKMLQTRIQEHKEQPKQITSLSTNISSNIKDPLLDEMNQICEEKNKNTFLQNLDLLENANDQQQSYSISTVFYEENNKQSINPINQSKNNNQQDENNKQLSCSINQAKNDNYQKQNIGYSFGQISKFKMQKSQGQYVTVLKREIDCSMSNFIKEQMQKNFEYLKSLNYSFLPKYFKIQLDSKSKIIILTEYLDFSLSNYLHSENQKLIPNKQKLQLLLLLAQYLKIMEDQNIFHGHLTPLNIFLIKDNQDLIITDYMFNSLKKLLSIKFNYTNKGVYSAPELLASNTNYIIPQTSAEDIYSFGVIAFEFITNKLPINFENEQLIENMLTKQQMSDNANQIKENQLKQLIQSCWRKDPITRPTYQQVIQQLQIIIDSFQEIQQK